MKLLVLLSQWKLLGGLYIGWGLGANDSSKIFGMAVATNSIRYRTAVILIAIFALTGALLEGPALYDNMKFTSGASVMTLDLAFAATFAAGAAIMMATIMGIPASSSQSAIGGIVGVSAYVSGLAGVDWPKLGFMMTCWLLTPFGGAFFGYILYRVVEPLLPKLVRNVQTRNRLIRVLIVVAGIYGAYTLGANNVVITTVAYYQVGIFGPVGVQTSRLAAAALGGIAIATGALTYSRKVMETVGRKITVLDPLSALLAVFAHSLTLHAFTQFHVPVSSSQATIGAIIGIGLVKGSRTLSKRQLAKIFAAWVTTPAASAILAYFAARLVAG